ncbi:MAG: DUF2029 domain-containing protein, partial [Candidatus Lokiarchaeota archaeon]|nr:DUF2029 domain-containing protein [Candidatus Lokiarchaeota archaeon]
MEFKEFKSIFRILISNKFIKIGIAVNFIFLIPSFISYIYQLSYPSIGNDFVVYYKAGYLVINDIENLYNTAIYPQVFRYLPFTAYLFSVFIIVPEPVAFFLFEITLFLTNIPSIIIIYYLVFNVYDIDKRYEQYVFYVLTLFLVFGPNVDNYFMGQINSLVAFFLLLSLYFFERESAPKSEKKKNLAKYSDFFGGFFLSLAITFKTYLIFLIPFVFIYKILLKNGGELTESHISRSNIQLILSIIPFCFAHLLPF